MCLMNPPNIEELLKAPPVLQALMGPQALRRSAGITNLVATHKLGIFYL